MTQKKKPGSLYRRDAWVGAGWGKMARRRVIQHQPTTRNQRQHQVRVQEQVRDGRRPEPQTPSSRNILEYFNLIRGIGTGIAAAISPPPNRADHLSLLHDLDVLRADRFLDLYFLARVAGWEPCHPHHPAHGMDMYHADPAQPLITAGEDLEDLDRDLPLEFILKVVAGLPNQFLLVE